MKIGELCATCFLLVAMSFRLLLIITRGFHASREAWSQIIQQLTRSAEQTTCFQNSHRQDSAFSDLWLFSFTPCPTVLGDWNYWFTPTTGFQTWRVIVFVWDAISWISHFLLCCRNDILNTIKWPTVRSGPKTNEKFRKLEKPESNE